jgi:hypothetical protein
LHQDFAPKRQSVVTPCVKFTGILTIASKERIQAMPTIILANRPAATADAAAIRLLPAAATVDSGKIRLGGAFRLLPPANRQA